MSLDHIYNMNEKKSKLIYDCKRELCAIHSNCLWYRKWKYLIKKNKTLVISKKSNAPDIKR